MTSGHRLVSSHTSASQPRPILATRGVRGRPPHPSELRSDNLDPKVEPERISEPDKIARIARHDDVATGACPDHDRRIDHV